MQIRPTPQSDFRVMEHLVKQLLARLDQACQNSSLTVFD